MYAQNLNIISFTLIITYLLVSLNNSLSNNIDSVKNAEFGNVAGCNYWYNPTSRLLGVNLFLASPIPNQTVIGNLSSRTEIKLPNTDKFGYFMVLYTDYTIGYASLIVHPTGELELIFNKNINAAFICCNVEIYL